MEIIPEKEIKKQAPHAMETEGTDDKTIRTVPNVPDVMKKTKGTDDKTERTVPNVPDVMKKTKGTDDKTERTVPNVLAVIFDLDGTLIDTEKYYRVCWPQAARDFGYEMTDEMALQLRSLGRPYSLQLFEKWYGPDFPYQKVREHRTDLINEKIKDGIELKPGAIEILTWLREQGILVAMATANPLERTEKYLQRLGLRDFFDRVICATMVTEGKPAPDVYRYACEQLNLPPEKCIAVEDSPNGVLSAYRAGCKVVMVPDQTQPDEELSRLLYAKADVLTDIRGLV